MKITGDQRANVKYGNSKVKPILPPPSKPRKSTENIVDLSSKREDKIRKKVIEAILGPTDAERFRWLLKHGFIGSVKFDSSTCSDVIKPLTSREEVNKLMKENGWTRE